MPLSHLLKRRIASRRQKSGSDNLRQLTLSETYGITKPTQNSARAQTFTAGSTPSGTKSSKAAFLERLGPYNASASSPPPPQSNSLSSPLELKSSPQSVRPSRSSSSKPTSTAERLSDSEWIEYQYSHHSPIFWSHPSRKRYQHEALRGNSHLRLLKLAKFGYVCEFDLVQFDLQQNRPPYKALSYVWGSHETPIDMPMVDGSSLPITKNLREALHRIINASKFAESTWLWIDQICIDQYTVQERNHQVRIMGDIYKNAEELVVWLGDWKSEMNNIAYLLPESEMVRNFHAKYFPGEHDVAHLGLVNLRLKGTPEDSPTLIALRTLFQKTWFTRAWVVQEAAMARQDVVFFGSKQTTLLQLYVICCVWLQHTEKHPHQKADELPEVTWLRLTEILTRRRQWLTRYTSLYGRDKFNLMTTLNRIGGCYSASDPWGLVYAFAGMCESDTQRIPVDYNSILSVVFEETARCLINLSGGLRLLGHCDRINGHIILEEPDRIALGSLPSWVSNWSLVRTVHSIDTDVTGNSLGYNACRGYQHKISTSDIVSELNVEGWVIDSVVAVSGYEISDSDSQWTQRYNPAGLFKLNETVSDLYDAEYLSDSLTFVRRLLKVLIEPGSRIDGIDPVELSQLLDILLSAYNKSRVMSSGSESQSQSSLFREDLETLYRYSIGVGSGRRFIRSYRNKLGLAPTSTKPLDQIAILHGSEVPIILRRVSPRHCKVIGQCYLEDAMEGAAV